MKDSQRFATILGALEVLLGLFSSSYQLHIVQMKSCKSHLLTRGLKLSGTSEGERRQTPIKNTMIKGEKYWNIPESVETISGRHQGAKWWHREEITQWYEQGMKHIRQHIHDPKEGQNAQGDVWQNKNSI